MKGIRMTFSLKKQVLHLLFLFTFLISGCVNMSRVVGIDNRIALQESENTQETFSQEGQTLEYSYRLSGNSLIVDGRVNASGYVNTLEVRILFLNEAGLILQQKILYYSGYRLHNAYAAMRTFEKTFLLPAGTTGLSFDFNVEYRSTRD